MVGKIVSKSQSEPGKLKILILLTSESLVYAGT